MEQKSRQLVKTWNGYAITFKSDYKRNPFVITKHGKVIERYADFTSCMIWLNNKLGDFNGV